MEKSVHRRSGCKGVKLPSLGLLSWLNLSHKIECRGRQITNIVKRERV
jgi:hypothetical protein